MIVPALVASLVVTAGSCAHQQRKHVTVPLLKDPPLAVRLTFNGRSALFMLDTGASTHAFARWFADASAMKVEGAESVQVRDPTGTTVQSQIVKDQEGMLSDGSTLAFESTIIVDFPPEFQKAGLGGLINPQLLASNAEAVVLDLRVPELRIEPFRHAVRRLGARSVASDQFRACRDDGGATSDLLFAIRATVEDRAGWLELDTGTGATALAAGSKLAKGLKLESGGQTMGAAGSPRTYSLARDLKLSFAGYPTTVDARIVDTTGEGCGPDGLLGRDALKPCALVFGQNALAMACD